MTQERILRAYGQLSAAQETLMEALRLAFVVRSRWTVVTALEALARTIIEQRKVILTVHMFRTRRQIELFHTGGASVAVLAKT